METKTPEKKESALEKINKIIFGVCAFVIVLLINDNRKTIEKMQQSMEQISTSYSKLDTRVSVLEYISGLEKKTIKIPINSKRTPPPELVERVLSKPEDEFKIKTNL